MDLLFEESGSNYCLRGFLSENKLKAFITLLYPESEEDEERKKPFFMMTRDVLRSHLKRYIPEDQIHVGVLDDIANHFNSGKETEKHRRVAIGTAAQRGRDGKLLLIKRPFTGNVEVAIDSSGTADYSRLNLFENIHAGDIVARVYPPTKGVDGIDVLGDPVGAEEGDPLELTLGEHLQRQGGGEGKAYDIIISTIDGYLTNEKNSLQMHEELLIRGDLDLRYGSIDFIGKVIVQGDVVPGVTIKARTGIEIQGACMGGDLSCPDGPIIVKGGVFGTGSCHILTGAHFEASIVNNATVESEGDIIITQEVRESLLISSSAVIAKRGTILGGRVKAVRGVEAKEIGSEGGIKTIIHLCRPCEASLEYVQLLLNIEKHKEILELLKLHLGPYAAQRDAGVPLSKDYENKMLTFVAKLERVEKSLQHFEVKREALERDDTGTEKACVSVSSKLWDGTMIISHGEEQAIGESLNGPISICYRADTEAIDVAEYQEVLETASSEEAA